MTVYGETHGFGGGERSLGSAFFYKEEGLKRRLAWKDGLFRFFLMVLHIRHVSSAFRPSGEQIQAQEDSFVLEPVSACKAPHSANDGQRREVECCRKGSGATIGSLP